MVIRARITQVKEGYEASWDNRVDKEEGDLRSLKAALGKKAKRKLDQAFKGCGCINVLPRYQEETGISREQLRDALQWHFDIPLQNTPLKRNGFSNLFKVEHECR